MGREERTETTDLGQVTGIRRTERQGGAAWAPRQHQGRARRAFMTPVGVKALRLPTGVGWTGRRITYVHRVGGGDVMGEGAPIRAPDPVLSATECAQDDAVTLTSKHSKAVEMSRRRPGRAETSTPEVGIDAAEDAVVATLTAESGTQWSIAAGRMSPMPGDTFAAGQRMRLTQGVA